VRLRGIAIAVDEAAREPDPIALCCQGSPLQNGEDMTKAFGVAPSEIALALALGLSACTNPYDPGQRAIGGGLIGAGAGAAIGAAAGGGTGAAIGAASGGALGAITGAVTTPPPPPPRY